MIIFACILLFFIILLTLKCTLTLKYDDELSLTLRILFFKFRLLPAKKKKYPKYHLNLYFFYMFLRKIPVLWRKREFFEQT